MLYRADFILAGVACHGSRPEASWTVLRFLPVVERRSLLVRLAKTLISILELVLKLLKKETYLARMSVLAENIPLLRTCCIRNVLVCLGQFQVSFTAVFQELYTLHHDP